MNVKSALLTALATTILLTLAGCHNPPPSTAMKSSSPALRGIKSWVAAGAGQYDGTLDGSLEYDHQVDAVFGKLALINAYRFTMALQSVDGRYAFVLHRNWAGMHFLTAPSAPYRALARAIGEGVSLAFRRPEGPWRADVKGSRDIVAYQDANDNRFRWWLAPGTNDFLLKQLTVKTPSGAHFAVTFSDDTAAVPARMTISDTNPRYVLQLQLPARNQATAMVQTR